MFSFGVGWEGVVIIFVLRVGSFGGGGVGLGLSGVSLVLILNLYRDF